MPETLEQLFAQAAQEDPRTAVILNVLRQAAERKGADDELETLRTRVERLERINAGLRKRLSSVAAALGSCPRCLGEAPSCPACGGDGVPGALRPDADAFARYVLPAVRRVRTQTTRHPDATTPTMEVS